ncbi:MAG: PLP-dependent aminotransferase family protein [Cellulomonadaceae bacterium]
MARSLLEATRIARLLGDWRDANVPVHESLALRLAELVDGAHLPAGWQMPSQRELAHVLGVARGTVVHAYDTLTTAGRLASRRGSGTFVRRATSHRTGGSGEGRLTSFAGQDAAVDLSSGALPGSELVARAMPEVGRLLHEHHLQVAGYYPAGLPELRTALAERFTQSGLPTRDDEVLVTAGSQQAVWLIATALAGPGTHTVVEDPSYRGALEAFSGAGSQVRGVRFTSAGPDLALLEAAVEDADLLYVQPSLHNPTGVHVPSARRRALADVADRHDLVVVDDQSQADLAWFRSSRLPGIEHLVDPDRLLVVGTLSKLFWGGIRIGWVRGKRKTIQRLTDVRSGVDLGGSVADQLAALLLLPHVDEQREVRRELLTRTFDSMTRSLADTVPGWSWQTPAGGSGLWVDTGTDAVVLAQRALARGIRLTPGPSFSPHGGHRSFLRLPVWHDEESFREAMHLVAGLADPGAPH